MENWLGSIWFGSGGVTIKNVPGFFIQKNGEGFYGLYDKNGIAFTGPLDEFTLKVLDAITSISSINDLEIHDRLNAVLNLESGKTITIEEAGQFGNNFKENGVLAWLSKPAGTSIMIDNGGNIFLPGKTSNIARDADLELVHELLGHGFQYIIGELRYNDRSAQFRVNGKLIGWATRQEADASSITTRAAQKSNRPQMWQPVYEERYIDINGDQRFIYHVIPRNYFINYSSSQKPQNYTRW